MINKYKEGKMETASQIIERYRQWDFEHPWEQKTKEQYEELLRAVQERKRELAEIIKNKQ